MLPLNARVILRSFTGIGAAPATCRPNENYWLLIGQSGTVIETINPNGRVLMQFDKMVGEYGLSSHNPVQNSLYILETDLEQLQ